MARLIQQAESRAAGLGLTPNASNRRTAGRFADAEHILDAGNARPRPPGAPRYRDALRAAALPSLEGIAQQIAAQHHLELQAIGIQRGRTSCGAGQFDPTGPPWRRRRRAHYCEQFGGGKAPPAGTSTPVRSRSADGAIRPRAQRLVDHVFDRVAQAPPVSRYRATDGTPCRTSVGGGERLAVELVRPAPRRPSRRPPPGRSDWRSWR